jgi:Zn-dependent protease
MIWYLSALQENPAVFFVFLAAWLVAVLTGLAFHEFCHAWSANQLGDDTAKRAGRLTLNPVKHLDPIGSTLLLFFGFGWAKPTPVNPWRLKTGPRQGFAMVAFAGPASNFFFAALAAIPIRFGVIDTNLPSIDAVIRHGSGEDFAWLFLSFIIAMNILLGVFNLIPIPPLDGFKIVTGVAPQEVARVLEQLAPWGPGILITLIAMGFVTGFSPLGWLIGLVYGDILRVILGT